MSEQSNTGMLKTKKEWGLILRLTTTYRHTNFFLNYNFFLKSFLKIIVNKLGFVIYLLYLCIMKYNIIYNEDCLVGLKKLPDNSIDCCISSPPYWGLRDYGTAKWVGGQKNCKHLDYSRMGGQGEASKKQHTNKGTQLMYFLNNCKTCGAKREDKQIGNEINFKNFIDSLIEIYNEVYRVLKPEGTCFVNLGDTYGGSGNGTTKNADTDAYIKNSKQVYVLPNGTAKSSKLRGTNLNKSLLMIPERFSISMLDNGWILRNQIIWHKPNQMPSSAKDRFTVDFEKIFFFVKQSKDYYFEQQLEPYTKPINRWGGNKLNAKNESSWDKGTGQSTYRDRNIRPNPKGKNMRTVWSINTKPFPDAHFAVFPEKLVERMIKAGCPEKGIVLDPFMGAGTTAVVSRKLNRNYIGYDLNKDYIDIANNRLHKELGLFN